MCRFVFYLGPVLTLENLVTRPAHSLVHQSFKSEERQEPLNGDGFGVGWFVPELSEDPAVFRAITPAWSNACLADLCRVTRSSCVLAHVRAASPGLPVTETNCHPFKAVGSGLAFMHNGHITGFSKIRQQLVAGLSESSYAQIQGSTDSEHMFAIFRDVYEQSEARGAEAMGAALDATLARIVELTRAAHGEVASNMNLVVTNGFEAAATRFGYGPGVVVPSLYLHRGRRYECTPEGLCQMVDPEREGGAAVILSSEKLSDDGGWERVPENHVVTVGADHSVTMRPCSAGA
jgi:glutamine amidotransferase